MTTVIEFDDVSKTFETKSGRFQALDGISLNVHEGDIFGLVGYSGAGKSTLLRTVNGLERPTSGRVLVGGTDVSRLGGRALSQLRNNVGMVFQQFNLLQSRNVYKNVAFPLQLAGVDKSTILDRVEELLAFVGLEDKALAYPAQLSGGQKQRVGIARALATRPDVLLSDEATSALDPQTTGEVLDVLRRVNEEYGVTILLVTHEMEVIRDLATRVAVMQQGRVVEHDSVYNIFASPKQPTTQRFVSSVMHHTPTEASLARMWGDHPGRLVQITVEDAHSKEPFLSRITRKNDIEFSIAYGGIDELQSQLYGTLIIELIGDDATIENTLDDLRAIAEVKELTHARP